MYRAGHYAGADGRDGRPAWAELLTHRVWQRQQYEDPHAAGCPARPGWLRAYRHCERAVTALSSGTDPRLSGMGPPPSLSSLPKRLPTAPTSKPHTPYI